MVKLESVETSTNPPFVLNNTAQTQVLCLGSFIWANV